MVLKKPKEFTRSRIILKQKKNIEMKTKHLQTCMDELIIEAY
jgi:hypothetical protein